MTIRNRITFWFTLTSSIIIFVFVLLIYLVIDETSIRADVITDLKNIEIILALAWFISVSIMFFVSRRLSYRFISPVSQIIKKVEEISTKNLHIRLNESSYSEEIAKLAASFNSMLDRLENSFDVQKEFVSNIAHELRTPLTAIICELQLLLAKENIPEKTEISLKKMLGDAQRLSRLCSNLMDMTKASYESHQVSLEKVRLDELIMEARNDMLNSNPDYNIRIKLDEKLDEENKVTILGNKYLLRTAFSNIMDNACKFSDDKAVTVSLEYNPENEKPMLSFIDQGRGIPEKEQEDIFAPFSRGSNSRNIEGSGIGLSLVKRIIKLHQATLKIDSTPGKGTTVCILWNKQ